MFKSNLICLFLVLVAFFGSPSFYEGGSGTLSIGPASTLAHTGVGGYVDVDAMVLNPSWLVDLPQNQITKLGVFRFNPQFETKLSIPDYGILDTQYVENKMADIQLPHIAYITQFSDSISYGFGFFTGGGSGADFTEAPDAYKAIFGETKSFFGSTSLVNSISAKYGSYRFGLTLDVVSGILSQSRNDPVNVVNGTAVPIKLDTNSTTTAMRYQFGMGYHVNPQLQVGLSYTTKLSLDFERGDVSYGPTGYVYDTRRIEEPSRISTGISFQDDLYRVIADFHYINWAATNYADYGWVDGTMFNVGLLYYLIPDTLNFSLGYSWASRVISDTTGVDLQTVLINTTFMPANLEQSFFLGAEYHLNPQFKLSGTFVYWPESILTQEGTLTESFSGTLKTQGYAMTIGFNFAF